MTVQQLIQQLTKLPQDAEVMHMHDEFCEFVPVSAPKLCQAAKIRIRGKEFWDEYDPTGGHCVVERKEIVWI